MELPMYEQLGQDPKWIKKLLFAGVFIQENKLHAIFDRYNEISSKQWLLMAVAASFDESPDLSMLAKSMGCSRQNVKKLALSLEKKEFVTLKRSSKDARSLCIVMSDKGKCFKKEMAKLTYDAHQALFSEFSDEEINQYYHLSIKLMHGIDNLEEFFLKQQQGEKKDDQSDV